MLVATSTMGYIRAQGTEAVTVSARDSAVCQSQFALDLGSSVGGWIHLGAAIASVVCFLFMGIYLLIKRREGERSRIILAGVMLLSVANHAFHMLNIWQTPLVFEVMPMHLLLIGVVVTVIYIMYPIEVASPGWLTWRRLLKIYILLTVGLGLIYKVPQWMGVDYTQYSTLSQMLAHPLSAQVIIRCVLVLLIFVPVVLLWFVPYTRKYNNTNHQWMAGYTITVVIYAVAYLTALTIHSDTIRPLYYLATILCNFYIFYQELFVRLIKTEKTEQQQ